MKIPFWGTIITLVAVFILCTLGGWQLDRHVWKQGLLSKIDAQYAVDASTVALDASAFEDFKDIKRGFIIGRYNHAKTLMVQPRTHDGVNGFHVLTPFDVVFEGGDDVTVLVNRGWIPVEHVRDTNFKIEKPFDSVQLIGMLRRPPRGNAFTPENDPGRGVWYDVDLVQISQVMNIDILSHVMFYVETEARDTEASIYPVSAATKIYLSNNHFSYAVFWFFMALSLVAIYILRFFRSVVRF